MSVPCSLVTTCWKWADPLALLCVVFSWQCVLWPPAWKRLTSWLFCVLCFLDNVFCDHLLEIADLLALLCVVFSWQCVLWSPAGNGLTSWLFCVLCFLDDVFCDHLLEMGWLLGSFVYCVFLTMCFVIICWKWADHLAFLCVVFSWQCVLWTPTGNGLTSWLYCVVFSWQCVLWSPTENGLTSWLFCVLRFLNNVFLSLSHMVSWVRCGTWLFRFLIFAFLTTLSLKALNREMWF